MLLFRVKSNPRLTLRRPSDILINGDHFFLAVLTTKAAKPGFDPVSSKSEGGVKNIHKDTRVQEFIEKRDCALGITPRFRSIFN